MIDESVMGINLSKRKNNNFFPKIIFIHAIGVLHEKTILITAEYIELSFDL